MGKKIIVSVINDLVTDQRVKKVCSTLEKMGFDIFLVGRRLRNSLPMDNRSYPVHRMKLLFEKGPLFYICFQWRLLLFLLFRKVDLLLSNDLDTLLPNFLVSRLKNIPLVYDSHEYFIGVPELQDHPVKKKIWKTVEKWIFPKLKNVFTVNDSIAKLYEKEYGIKPVVIKNVPPRFVVTEKVSRKKLGLPEDNFILVLQGSGINMHRGAEEMVEAMQWIENALLLIIGKGDVLGLLQERTKYLHLQDRVRFISPRPYNELMQYTMVADLGLTLDKDTNVNYRFSLPNKIFDYIHAGIPVLASHLPEVEKVVKNFDIGDFIPDHHPENIARKVNEIINSPQKLSYWKENTKKAAKVFNWENEAEKLRKVYAKYV